MICNVCGKNVKFKGEEISLIKPSVFVCEVCEGIKKSFKYFIGGKEISKEEYDRIVKGE